MRCTRVKSERTFDQLTEEGERPAGPTITTVSPSTLRNQVLQTSTSERGFRLKKHILVMFALLTPPPFSDFRRNESEFSMDKHVIMEISHDAGVKG